MKEFAMIATFLGGKVEGVKSGITSSGISHRGKRRGVLAKEANKLPEGKKKGS